MSDNLEKLIPHASAEHSHSSFHMTPEGLYYYPDAIPEDFADRLLTFLDQDCELFPVLSRNAAVPSANARRVAHYGFRYDYSRGGVSDPAPDFPAVIEELCALIYETHSEEFPDGYWFDQCIINRYLPGQGIGAHYDREEYGEFIACFTLCSGAEMEFTSRERAEHYHVYTEPRSLYIMSGKSRHEYTHMMRARKSDPGHGQRGTRWSLTFRSVCILDAS